jgi:hypothetical protein
VLNGWFSKLEKRAEQVLPGSERRGGRGAARAPGRDDPNNVCTYEYMNRQFLKMGWFSFGFF